MGLWFFSRKRKAKNNRKAALRVEPLEDRALPSCSAISGFVYHDANGNGLFDSGEQAVANSPIELRNAQGAVVGSATTDANGFYSFAHDQSISTAAATLTKTLSFPSTQTNFSLTGLVDQFDPSLGQLLSVEITHSGSITSEIRVENTSPTSPSQISGTVSGTLTLSGGGVNIPLNFSDNAGTYNASTYDGTIDFGGASGNSFAPRTASDVKSVTLSGAALQPFIGNGKVSFTETSNATSRANGGGNLVVSLLSSASALVTVSYRYVPSNCLASGSYTIVQTQQPAGFLDGRESSGGVVRNHPLGTDSIPVTLAGANLPDNNFGEVRAASLAGWVYHDVNNNGVKDGPEGGIAGAQITLTGVDDFGPVSRTATTDGGTYQFTNLRPGQYTLTETQPASWMDGTDALGSQGGTASNDVFSSIVLGSGTQGVNNNFGELRAASLSGYVYVDANDNGVKDPGESGIGGVQMTLSGVALAGVGQATTDSSGFYEFANLRPATYTLSEAQPAGYGDGKDALGSQGGTAGNDQFSNILLLSDMHGVNNNFGELETADLGITKVAAPPSVLVGGQFSYTVTVTNHGNATARNVLVTDNLPPQVTLLDVTGPGWVIALPTTSGPGGTFSASTQTLPVGASATLFVTVQAPIVPGSVTNVANVSSSTPDNNPTNNRAEVTTQVFNQPGSETPPTVTPLAMAFGVPIIGKNQLFSDGGAMFMTTEVKGSLALVSGLYTGLLGRSPDYNSHLYYARQLTTGAVTRQQLVNAFWYADEHRGLQADQFFATFYRRAPSASERQAVVNQLRSGMSEMQIMLNFVTSAEYQAAHPTAAALAMGIARDVQGRVPDLSSQLLLLQGMTTDRVALAQAILNQPATYQRVVSESFLSVLRRAPQTSELNFYTSELQSGRLSPGDLMRKLIASDEFFNYAASAATLAPHSN